MVLAGEQGLSYFIVSLTVSCHYLICLVICLKSFQRLFYLTYDLPMIEKNNSYFTGVSEPEFWRGEGK